jgi:manganese transport protein
MYRHILVALENAPADEPILEHVVALATQHGASVTLIHVADGFVARHHQQLNLAASPEIVKDHEYLDAVQQRLSTAGLRVEATLECGDTVKEILAAARARGCDLIAMGIHGHRWLADVVLGSVADAVRHRSEVPVLMIPTQMPKKK